MSEPTFAVPLSKLVEIDSVRDRWFWSCEFSGGSWDLACDTGSAPSRAEAESAAIEHLAEVHGLTVAAEDDSRETEEDARFKHLRTLEPNWDSYEALPVQPGMEDRARSIIAALRRNSPRICPTPEGGIQLEWGHEIEVTVEPEGMSVMFGDSCLEETGE